ncbi:MAG: DUF3703 domain-containing protein [Sphingomonas sp.]
MAYLIGIALAFGVIAFSRLVGFDRSSSYYPLMVIVVASYYVLFAVIGGSGEALRAEILVLIAFVAAAVGGFRLTLWLAAAGLIGHGLLDAIHADVISDAGVPSYWPAFCMAFDLVVGGYLAIQLLSGKTGATSTTTFGRRIRSSVDAELAAARAAELGGEPFTAFRHLERAHILGQSSTVQHVRVHLRMFRLGVRRHDLREVFGQIVRIMGAGIGTCMGLVPQGNTGGANVSGFKSMAIPDDLAGLIAKARSSVANASAWDGQ